MVEREGTRMVSNVKSNPLGVKSCWNDECAICRGEGKSKDCRARGPVYEQRCMICRREGKEVVYYGETGRNAFIRGKEHDRDLRLGDKKNGLVRHMMDEHEGQDNEFQMAVIAKHRGCLGRQVEEAVRIRESEGETLLNLKAEFMQPHLIRLEIEEGNVEDRRGWW